VVEYLILNSIFTSTFMGNRSALPRLGPGTRKHVTSMHALAGHATNCMSRGARSADSLSGAPTVTKQGRAPKPVQLAVQLAHSYNWV
jgi:hypothetical protein